MARHLVGEDDTAVALGSGDVPVLGTPRLIAWLEAATVSRAAEFLTSGQTTVGTAIRIAHHRATPVGGAVTTNADVTTPIDGRTITFVVRAVDESGAVVADGEIDRVVVDREKFVARASR